MKTPSTIKATSALFTAALLLNVSGRADQNFNQTYNYSTPGYANSPYGVSAVLAAHDDFTVPTATTAGTYSVTAIGNVTGKIPGRNFTAVSANGTAKVMRDGSATFSGSLQVAEQSIINISSVNISSYTSTHFIREVSAVGSIPLEFGFCTVSYQAKASVDACFRADAVFTTTTIGVPKVALSIGPEADLGASAGVSKTLGIPGIASLSAGVSGNLSLGKVALKANATVVPTSTPIVSKKGNARRIGAIVQARVDASTTGVNGSLDVFAQAEIPFLGTFRASQNIANYASGSQSTPLLAPQTFTWF